MLVCHNTEARIRIVDSHTGAIAFVICDYDVPPNGRVDKSLVVWYGNFYLERNVVRTGTSRLSPHDFEDLKTR